MIPEAYFRLFDSLHDKTMEGKVNWQPTAKENTFAVYLEDVSITISPDRRPFEQTVEFVVQFSIRNKQGAEIDSFEAGDETDPAEVWQKATDLLDAARRKAFRIDETIADIMNQLRSEGPIGEEPEPPADLFEDDDLPF